MVLPFFICVILDSLHVQCFGVLIMAKFNVELETMERMWVLVALQNQQKVLQRSLAKERVGSDIYNLRGKEIQVVGELARRFIV